WLCENSERAFTEGNRVLPAPRFPCCLATARNDIGAGEEGHSMRSACPSVLTRPRPIADIAHRGALRCSIFMRRGARTDILLASPKASMGDHQMRRRDRSLVVSSLGPNWEMPNNWRKYQWLVS